MIDKEDKQVVEDFLRYIAISELGIYTILGSKPVTRFHIPQTEPPGQLRANYAALPKKFQKKISFEKFDTTERIEELQEICKKWMNIQHKYVGDHFSIHFDNEMRSGITANIPLVIYILRKYYQDFSNVLGADFDPVVFSREIGKSSSDLWRTFKKNADAYLWGLLFGFGEKNSKFFQWEKEKSVSFPFRVGSYDLPLFKKRPIPRDEKIESLGIPQFVVYQPIDRVVEKYSLERERIIQIYKGKDFAETTVSYLTGEAARHLSKRKNSIHIQIVDGNWVVEKSH